MIRFDKTQAYDTIFEIYSRQTSKQEQRAPVRCANGKTRT